MARSVQLRLTVFTLGVLMLLLRPYCVYQMTAQDVRNDPARAWNLLQRLVKKKDEHHAGQASDSSAMLNAKTTVPPERKFLLSLLAVLALLAAKFAVFLPPVFKFIRVSQRYRYKSLSSLLI